MGDVLLNLTVIEFVKVAKDWTQSPCTPISISYMLNYVAYWLTVYPNLDNCKRTKINQLGLELSAPILIFILCNSVFVSKFTCHFIYETWPKLRQRERQEGWWGLRYLDSSSANTLFIQVEWEERHSFVICQVRLFVLSYRNGEKSEPNEWAFVIAPKYTSNPYALISLNICFWKDGVISLVHEKGKKVGLMIPCTPKSLISLPF